MALLFTAIVLLPLVLVAACIVKALWQFFFGSEEPEGPREKPPALQAEAEARQPVVVPMPRQITLAATKACPRCGSPVAVGSRACRSCGRELRRPAPVAPTAA